MEAAVGQQLLPLEQLGGPARALRAFRRLLFLETAEVEGSPVLRELPRPELLHHLYSRAPPQLESPHARSSLTPAQVGAGASSEPPTAEQHQPLHACLPPAPHRPCSLPP